jgi:hypothetical protein
LLPGPAHYLSQVAEVGARCPRGWRDRAIGIGPPRATSAWRRSSPRPRRSARTRSTPVTASCPKTRLARACAGEGIAFIGPAPETLEAAGDKLAARRHAAAAGAAGRARATGRLPSWAGRRCLFSARHVGLVQPDGHWARAISAMIRSLTGCRLTVAGSRRCRRCGRALAIAVDTGLGSATAYDYLPPERRPHLHVSSVDELLAMVS